MRLAILTGLIVGMALGVQSVHDAHLKATETQAPSAVRVHASAPWYVAMNPGNGTGKRATLAGLPSYPLKLTSAVSILGRRRE
jgi:hypothetical protein